MNKKVDLSRQLETIFSHGISGIIFDCDGVLIDARKVNIGYYNMLLKELGYGPMTTEQETYAYMASVQQCLDYIIPKEAESRLHEIVSQNPYKTVALPYLKLEPGLIEFLEWLKDKGIFLGIQTNRGSKGMNDVIEFLGLTGFFDPVMTIDSSPAKPHPGGILRILEMWEVEPYKVAFIGDSTTDEGAAQAAFVPLISYCNTSINASIHVECFSSLHNAFMKFIG